MTTNLPTTYLAARKALAECVRIDSAKSIRDKSIALEVYAYQAKDAQLAGDAAEIKKRAERRIGELMNDLRAAGKLAKGAARKGVGRKGKRGSPADPHLLPDQGIDKHLADRSRKAARLDAGKFEAEVRKARDLAAAVAERSGDIISAARAERHRARKKQRADREKHLSEKIVALPQKKYGVIVADPEWRFEAWSPKGLDATSPDNHYKTSVVGDIEQRDVQSIAAEDCVLFLWGTNPMLPEALAVMNAWGFRYVSNYVWVKHKAGTGYWNRAKHELLLIGRRGAIPAPPQGEQWESVIIAPAGKHSEKPQAAFDMIEQYYPNLPKIELNARRLRPGWDVWGTLELVQAAE